jgi:pimeloyl-ACP methyl ester carboxylesterase
MSKLEGVLRQVREIPALLLWGDRDRAVSLESGDLLRRYFKQSELVVLPCTGHLPYEECPEVFSRLVNSFLVKMRGKSAMGPHLVHQALS